MHWGTLLYSRLSNKNRFLLELHYAVFKKNFKVLDDVQILTIALYRYQA